MTLNTRQKAMIAIGGLALAGLAVDRLFLQEGVTGPTEAGASSLAVPSIAPGATPNPPTAPGSRIAATSPKSAQPGNKYDLTPPNLDDEGSLARRLSRVADRQEARGVTTDAFEAPGAWSGAVKEADKPGGATAAQAAPNPVAFAAKHRLSGLMRDAGTQGIAVIDGKPWRVGEAVEGWAIESIASRSVTLRQGNVRVRLELAVPSATRRNAAPGSDR